MKFLTGYVRLKKFTNWFDNLLVDSTKPCH
jgi:hypothetical protein